MQQVIMDTHWTHVWMVVCLNNSMVVDFNVCVEEAILVQFVRYSKNRNVVILKASLGTFSGGRP